MGNNTQGRKLTEEEISKILQKYIGYQMMTAYESLLEDLTNAFNQQPEKREPDGHYFTSVHANELGYCVIFSRGLPNETIIAFFDDNKIAEKVAHTLNYLSPPPVREVSDDDIKSAIRDFSYNRENTEMTADELWYDLLKKIKPPVREVSDEEMKGIAKDVVGGGDSNEPAYYWYLHGMKKMRYILTGK